MNVRTPSPIPEDLLRIQDVYLRERNSERGVSRFDDIPTADVSLGSDIPLLTGSPYGRET